MHIHPFPARMAPEIAMRLVGKLPQDAHVLDPMAGSGMVLQQCARAGIRATGRDLDPLACLISRTATSIVDVDEVYDAVDELVERAEDLADKHVSLPWIDDDPETARFIDYWFGSKQQHQIRRLSHLLFVRPINVEQRVLDVLAVSLSRLIITKEPKASRARDTAHSRPHRTIMRNDFDVYRNLPASAEHVANTLAGAGIRRSAQIERGDARQLRYVRSESVDAVITSPPYLNAIDYMRGHRLSLVWMGHRLKDLSVIRSSSIGSELSLKGSYQRFDELVRELGMTSLQPRFRSMLRRYYVDLTDQLAATTKVLRKGGVACYVIGNCNVRGTYVRNNRILRDCAQAAGLSVVSETRRQIPEKRRYLPLITQAGSLGGRMRTEHILEFKKRG